MAEETSRTTSDRDEPISSAAAEEPASVIAGAAAADAATPAAEEGADGEEWFGEASRKKRISYIALNRVADEEAEQTKRRTTFSIIILLVILGAGVLAVIWMTRADDTLTPEEQRRAQIAERNAAEATRVRQAADEALAEGRLIGEGEGTAFALIHDRLENSLLQRQAVDLATVKAYKERYVEAALAAAAVAEGQWVNVDELLVQAELDTAQSGFMEMAGQVGRTSARPDVARALEGLLRGTWVGARSGNTRSQFTRLVRDANIAAALEARALWASVLTMTPGELNERAQQGMKTARDVIEFNNSIDPSRGRPLGWYVVLPGVVIGKPPAPVPPAP